MLIGPADDIYSSCFFQPGRDFVGIGRTDLGAEFYLFDLNIALHFDIKPWNLENLLFNFGRIGASDHAHLILVAVFVTFKQETDFIQAVRYKAPDGFGRLIPLNIFVYIFLADLGQTAVHFVQKAPYAFHML